MAERRFIDANNLIEEIREERCYNCRNFKDMKCDYCGTADYIYMIEDMPAADVARVRHGRWIEPQRLYYGAKQYECSLCYSDIFWKKHSITEKYPYCPNCGCRMDGGAD